MSKTLKMCILLMIITLGMLCLSQNYVSAAYIDSVDTLKEVFKGKNATIEGKTITLTGNLEDNDVYEISGDYILDLNGYKFTACEVYINEGSLTINDSKGKGELDTTADWLYVEEGAKLTINNGKFDYLVNSGTTIINDGIGDMVTNDGTITINAGTFGGLWQRGKGTLKGGTFTANFACSTIDLITGSTVISGNVEFKRTEENDALIVYSLEAIDGTIINQLLTEGYISASSGYGSNSDSWYDEELKETITQYEIKYEPIVIIKDETNSIFDKIAPNGVWQINGTKPQNMEEAEFLLTAMAGDVEVAKGYELMAWVEPADKFNPEVVEIHLYYNGSLLKSKTVKAVYNEPSKEVKTKVGAVVDKIAKKTGENHDVKTGFRLEDLYLINYLNATKKEFNSSLALNFAKDLIELTNGANMSYKFDSRLGDSTPTGLWNYTGGEVIVYHDGVAVGTTKIGLTLNNVLYVSSDTANSDEARIAAALKRIEEYLGTTKGISIKVGGTLESLNEDGETWNKHGFIDEKTCGSNYYNVTVNGETYKFAICKKEESKLEVPKYIGSNLGSNITITSDDKTIPLDTSIIVDEVKENKKNVIKNALGTSTYTAYDISLYSNTTQKNITKLENGQFKVGIPLPKEFKGKDDITVYFIDDDGKKDDMKATVKDGIVSFETNHFSTYVIAQRVEETPKQENKGDKDVSPDTGNRDIIGYVFAVTVISTLGVIELKRKK